MRKFRRRGLSLPELLVASAISLLLLGILYRVFSVGYRIGHRELNRSSTEQGLLLMGQRLERDLQTTTASGVSLSADGRTVVTHPLGGVTEAGRHIFEELLWIWSWNSEEEVLTRLELTKLTEVEFNGTAIRFTPSQLARLDEMGERRPRHTLDRVKEFKVANPSGLEPPLVGSPLSILIARRTGVSDSERVYTYEMLLRLRNPVR